jgi:glutathione S-transferase fosA5
VHRVIQGFSHVTLSVRDLERAFTFYRDVLELRPLVRWTEGAYLLAGESAWLCLSLDPRTRRAPLDEYTHIAFSVAPERFEETCARVRTSGVSEWKHNTSEGDSLYLLDPDGHKLELHVGDWRSRLAACRSRPRDGMEFF